MRRLLIVLFVVVLVAGGASGETDGIRVAAFDFSLEDINPGSPTHGQTLSVSQLYAEHGLVLQFIASWCKPCRDELPGLQRFHEEAETPIVLVAADENGFDESVLILAERHALTTPILFAPLDRVGEIEAHYDYEILPATYLIDRVGVIRWVHQGAMSRERLSKKIADQPKP